MSDRPTLDGARVHLRPIAEPDRAAVEEMLGEPEVARWWGTTGAVKAAAEAIEATDAVVLAIEADGGFCGFIQYSEEEEPDYRHASIDIALRTASQNRGLGRDALRTLARYLFDVRRHHRLTIDPAASNVRAIRLRKGRLSAGGSDARL